MTQSQRCFTELPSFSVPLGLLSPPSSGYRIQETQEYFGRVACLSVPFLSQDFFEVPPKVCKTSTVPPPSILPLQLTVLFMRSLFPLLVLSVFLFEGLSEMLDFASFFSFMDFSV